MKLQVAFDVKNYKTMEKILYKIADLVDIIEVGTLLIKSEGIGVIKKTKKYFSLPVFADLKCMDAGRYEVEIAAECEADYVTVLASSYDKNIEEVIDACKANRIKSVVDSINSPIERILKIQKMGIDIVELHSGYISSVGKRSWTDLKQFYSYAIKPIFISGGINSKNVVEIEKYNDKIEAVVVGRAIICSKNPREETEKIRKIIDNF